MLIAETGGQNAMIVDSTALPEQAVDDIVTSSFQSAGQRCSALRMLYVQEDTRDRMIEMLTGAMDALVTGDPWFTDTDIAPVIDAKAQADIADYIARLRSEGRVVKELPVPERGTYVGAALIELNAIKDLEREVFGPVLHIATFKASEIDATVDAINAKGFGLTFGLHTRIDDRGEAGTVSSAPLSSMRKNSSSTPTTGGGKKDILVRKRRQLRRTRLYHERVLGITVNHNLNFALGYEALPRYEQDGNQSQHNYCAHPDRG